MNEQLNLLQDSISNFRVVFLKYKNGIGVISEREIEPLALFFEQNEWKTVAFCRLRHETRTFLMTRIYSLDATEKEFAPNQFSLEDYFRNNFPQ